MNGCVDRAVVGASFISPPHIHGDIGVGQLRQRRQLILWTDNYPMNNGRGGTRNDPRRGGGGKRRGRRECVGGELLGEYHGRSLLRIRAVKIGAETHQVIFSTSILLKNMITYRTNRTQKDGILCRIPLRHVHIAFRRPFDWPGSSAVKESSTLPTSVKCPNGNGD